MSRSPCPWWARCVGLHFSATPAVDYDTASTTDEAAYAGFFHALLDQGVALAPGPYEVAFPGLAHNDAVLDEIVARTDHRPPLHLTRMSTANEFRSNRARSASPISCRGRGGRGGGRLVGRFGRARARRGAGGWP